MVKGPNFINYIYFLKVVHFFIIRDVKDTTNFIIGLQMAMLLIAKK